MSKRRAHTSHLRNSILYTSLFTIVGILIVLFPIFYSLAGSLLQRNSIVYTEQLLRQVNNSINYYVTEMTNVSEYIVADADVIRYMTGDGSAGKGLVAAKLQTISGVRPDFVNLIIFREDQTFVSNRDQISINPNWDYRDTAWYQKTMAAGGQPVFSSSRVENIVAGEYQWVVTLSRSLYVDGRRCGILLIDLNYRQITDICSHLSFNDNGYIFIVGEDGRLVYHPQQRLIYSGIKSERFDLVTRSDKVSSVTSNGFIYTSSLSGPSGWVTVSVFDTNRLVSVSPGFIMTYAAVGLFFALIAFVISFQASRRLTDPILELGAQMRRFEQGDFAAHADLKVNNEVAELGHRFNAMTERIKNLMDNTLLIEEQKRKSEIQSLQAQIRPHFLYNTLESIIWMAEMGENAKVIDMTSSLSKLMRVSVNNASDLVTVREEMDYVGNYLFIQKMRYQDKLNYRLEIDEAIRPAKMLRLLVQPLVENAIYHGIKPLRRPGLIVISAFPQEKKLIIRVGDNGVGFNPDYQAASDISLSDEKNGIGLTNVSNRIKLFFGAPYGLEITSAARRDGAAGGLGQEAADNGDPDCLRTIVTLTLPLIFE